MTQKMSFPYVVARAISEMKKIMPMNYRRYPMNWKEISRRIRSRAHYKCEWCGVENNAIGFRDEKGRFIRASHGTRIVLTTAHLGALKPDGSPGDKHDKMDCRDENLAALCQRCHLNFDREDHVLNRRRNRSLALEKAGQLLLL